MYVLFREFLQIQLRLYGPNHPDTLWSKQHLASSYFNFRYYTLKLQRDTRNPLQSSIQELGLNNSETVRHKSTVVALKSMSKLACCYSKLSDNERAIQLQLETVEIQK